VGAGESAVVGGGFVMEKFLRRCAMLKIVGRNKEEIKSEVEIYGKICNLKQIRIFLAAVNSLYDSTNFYVAYKQMYDNSHSCMVTLENDRYLLRFLVPSYISEITVKKQVFLFSLRGVSPMEMALYILENSDDILVRTPRGRFKISPPDGGALDPYAC
jgi:hypothetical protein